MKMKIIFERDTPLIINVSTLTVILMYYRILEFLAHIALGIGFSAFIPLLWKKSSINLVVT